MKISTLAFILTALLAATPMLTLCKKSANKYQVETIRPCTNIRQYPNFYNYFLQIPLRRNMEWYNGEKILLYIYPEGISKDGVIKEEHLTSLEDAAIYKRNNVVVWKKNCEFKTMHNLKKIEGGFWRGLGSILTGAIWKNRPVANRECYFISDDNKKIDLWASQVFMSDLTFYYTSHKGRIAILIDEKGYIVSILDDVKSERDIFRAFGIE